MNPTPEERATLCYEHSKPIGILPDTRRVIAEQIRQAEAAARAEEREACFQIAANCPVLGGKSAEARFHAGKIAAAIRARND